MPGLNASLQAQSPQDRPSLMAVDVSSVGAMDLCERLSIRFAVVSSWPVGPPRRPWGGRRGSGGSHPTARGHVCGVVVVARSVGEPQQLPWMPSELFAFTQSVHQQAQMALNYMVVFCCFR